MQNKFFITNVPQQKGGFGLWERFWKTAVSLELSVILADCHTVHTYLFWFYLFQYLPLWVSQGFICQFAVRYRVGLFSWYRYYSVSSALLFCHSANSSLLPFLNSGLELLAIAFPKCGCIYLCTIVLVVFPLDCYSWIILLIPIVIFSLTKFVCSSFRAELALLTRRKGEVGKSSWLGARPLSALRRTTYVLVSLQAVALCEY